MAKKNGTTISELYIKIGADISELESDLALADKTVVEAMKKIGGETKKIKLQADIDLEKIKGSNDITKEFEIRQKALQKQLTLSADRVRILAREYQHTASEAGKDAAISHKLELRLMEEQKAYERLKNRLHDLNEEKRKSTSISGRISNSDAVKELAAQTGLTAGVLGGIGAKSLKFGAAAAAIYGTSQIIGSMKTFTMDAMKAGEEAHKMALKFNLSNAEAVKLAYGFRLINADANAAIPLLVKLDNEMADGSDASSKRAQAMQRFGVSLTDTTGKLLPYNDQLNQLAQGYDRAQQKGQAEAFVAGVLGARGAQLVPILAQWAENSELLSRVKMTGVLDVDKADQLYKEWQLVGLQSGQLKLAIGGALLPVADEIIPQILESMQDLATWVSENKSDIKAFGTALADSMRDAKQGVKELMKDLDGLGINLKNVTDTMNKDNYMKANHPYIHAINTGIGGLIYGKAMNRNTVDKFFAEDYKSEQTVKRGVESGRGESELAAWNKLHTAKKKIVDANKNVEDSAKKAGDAEKKAAEEALAANTELQNKLYEIGHNDLENAMNRIDLEAAAYKKRGADEELIAQETEAAKAKIKEDFAENVTDKLQAVYKSELQNRLDDIEKEKKAYLKKGADEVDAAKWAEHEKRMARINEARSALKEERDMLDAMRTAMAGGGTQEEKMNRAKLSVLDAMRKKYGITENDRTSPEEMAMFSDMKRWGMANLIPGLEEDSLAVEAQRRGVQVIRGNNIGTDYYSDGRILGQYGIDVHRGATSTVERPPIAVNVTFHDTMVEDDLMKTKIVNDVSGAVAKIVNNAADAGGGWNGY